MFYLCQAEKLHSVATATGRSARKQFYFSPCSAWMLLNPSIRGHAPPAQPRPSHPDTPPLAQPRPLPLGHASFLLKAPAAVWPWVLEEEPVFPVETRSAGLTRSSNGNISL